MVSWNFDWYMLGAIMLLCLCSFLTRCSYMLFGDKFPLSDGVRSALRYAPVAALVGIIIPELIPLSANPALIINSRAIAAVVAVILYLRTSNALYVILGGMVALWVIDLLRNVVF